MNRTVLLSLVAVVMMLVPSVKLRAEGNLDDSDTSIVSPRFDATGKIAVDAGLIYLLNKYMHAPGTDKAAIDTLKRKLERTSMDFNVLKREARAANDLLARKEGADWAKINDVNRKRSALNSQISSLAQKRAELMKFSADMRADRAVALRAANKLASVEKQIAALRAEELALAEGLGDILSPDARRAAEELVAARDRAAKLVGDLSDDLTHAERVGTGMKVVRIAGNIALGLDVVGHGWAFYDNSSTPLAFGGLSKLNQEAHDLMFAKVKERATPKGQPMTREEIQRLPTRNSLVPSGNVPENKQTHDPVTKKPRNRRPPLLKEEPNLDAPIPALP